MKLKEFLSTRNWNYEGATEYDDGSEIIIYLYKDANYYVTFGSNFHPHCYPQDLKNMIDFINPELLNANVFTHGERLLHNHNRTDSYTTVYVCLDRECPDEEDKESEE